MKVERDYNFIVEPADFGIAWENATSQEQRKGKGASTSQKSKLSMRVDAFLAAKVQEISRSALTGNSCSITINDKSAKKSDKVYLGDRVELHYVSNVFDKVTPQDIPLDILYEDSDMLVINKPQGLIVHPGAGNPDGTLVNALAFRYGQTFIDEMADQCDISRPGIVHRLDKDTSGVMVIALNARAHAELSQQFQSHEEINKTYYAFCDGIFQIHQDTIECLLARDRTDRKLFTAINGQRQYIIQGGLTGKNAQAILAEVFDDPKYRAKTPTYGTSEGKFSKSQYEVVRQLPQAALVKVRIFTGRTHQIRVHMKYIGHPVVGDVLYNNKLSRFPGATLMLHSAILEIKHPTTGQLMKFEAPLPQRFTDFEQRLRNS